MQVVAIILLSIAMLGIGFWIFKSVKGIIKIAKAMKVKKKSQQHKNQPTLKQIKKYNEQIDKENKELSNEK